MYRVSLLLVDWVWVDLNFHCLPDSAWADGNLEEAPGQLVQHPDQSLPNPVSEHMGHPVDVLKINQTKQTIGSDDFCVTVCGYYRFGTYKNPKFYLIWLEYQVLSEAACRSSLP